jgi:hypothetical protein
METKTYIVVYSDADMTTVQKVALNATELTQLANLRTAVKEYTTGASLMFFPLDEMNALTAAEALPSLARVVQRAVAAGA